MVGDLPPGGVEIAIEVAGLSCSVGRTQEQAQALLEPLRRAVDFQDAWIAVLKPDRNAYVSLVVPAAQPQSNLELAASSAAVEGTERIGLHRSTRPVLGRDRAIPLWADPNWAHLWPAGYRDEIAVGLHVDGLHIGAMALLTDSPTAMTEPVRELVAIVGPMIARAVDPMQSVAAAARLVHDADAGIVLAANAAPLPLPGLPTHRLLRPGSPVLSVAAVQVTARDRPASFLCQHPGRTTAPRLARITVIGLPPSAVGLSAVVTVSPPGDLRGLTPRELQILGLVIEGWSNRQIARYLVITVRTVAAHVEHILAKLDATNRTEAAVRALRRQLYVPASLAAIGAAGAA